MKKLILMMISLFMVLEAEVFVYEDAEDNNASRWKVEDAIPLGSTITALFDTDKNSTVIEFNGTGTSNSYMIGNYENQVGAWNNQNLKTLQWSMFFPSNDFILYVRIETVQGMRYLSYNSKNKDDGIDSDDNSYIYFGLGTESIGSWGTFTRDLEADLKRYEPNNSLNTVNGLIVRGDGRIDDIRMTDEFRLLFRSGFENNVSVTALTAQERLDFIAQNSVNCAESNASKKTDESYSLFIHGSDNPLGHWPINILGSANNSIHVIDEACDEEGIDVITNEIINFSTGHNQEPTQVYHSSQLYPQIDASQSPYEITDLLLNPTDMYIKYWIKLDQDSLTQNDMWRTFFEYKTENYEDDNDSNDEGFRLISYIQTDNSGNLFWRLQGDQNSSDSDETTTQAQATGIPWGVNSTIELAPLINGEWFKTEFYWEWLNETNGTGRVTWKINDKVVAQHTGLLTVNQKRLNLLILTQLYGHGGDVLTDTAPKEQWIDDIEIWEGIPTF